MTETMKAAVIHEYGKSGVLHVEDTVVPKIGADELLVKVITASINPRDWLLMRGIYQGKRFVEPLPATLGSDFSGIVSARGSKVKNINIGDNVFGMQPLKGKFGAFAEYIKIRADAVALKPDTITHKDAAAMPCAGMTSYQTIHEIVSLKAGERILINGASGGVGVYAIQIAKACGAHVTAVCSDQNTALCYELGADAVINYRAENFEQRSDEFDVVYDVIGRSGPKQSTLCLRDGGRYITTIPNSTTLLAAGKSWLASHLMPGKRKTTHLVMVKPKPSNLTAMAKMITNKEMKTVVDSQFSLDDIQMAIDHSQSWRTRGKIIINIS